MKETRHKLIGDLLIEANIITKKQLEWALKEQQKHYRRIGEILMSAELVREEVLYTMLERQLGIPYVKLEQHHIDFAASAKIPLEFARAHCIVALTSQDGTITVAMNDPVNTIIRDDIKAYTKQTLQPLLASAREISTLIEQVYSNARMNHLVDQLERQFEEGRQNQELASTVLLEDDKLETQLIDSMLKRCIFKGCSDIHIEPFENYVRIRYRLDGQLYELERMSKEMLSTMTIRLKVLANLDIAEHRLPQDGHMSFAVKDQVVDLRISILPTLYGEKTVIRIIYCNEQLLRLEDILFHPKDLEKVMALLRQSHGSILLTGPTGSGKSTTLTAALRYLNQENTNIITV